MSSSAASCAPPRIRREVVTDVHARYFGTELNDRSLTAGDGARIAATRYQDWLRHPVRPN